MQNEELPARPKARQSTTINALPLDILICIMDSASLSSLANCARVNSMFHEATLGRLRGELVIEPWNWCRDDAGVSEPGDIDRESHCWTGIKRLKIDNTEDYDWDPPLKDRQVEEIASCMRGMTALESAVLDLTSASSSYNLIRQSILPMKLRRLDLRITITLPDAMVDWQELVYKMAESLEYLGIYIISEVRTASTQAVPQFPRLQTIAYESDSHEDTEVLPFELLRIVDNSPELDAFTLNGSSACLGAASFVIRRYGAKLRVLSFEFRRSIYVTAKAWKASCPNINILKIEDCLTFNQLSFLDGAFPSLRQLRVQCPGASCLSSWAGLFTQPSYLPNLQAVYLTRRAHWGHDHETLAMVDEGLPLDMPDSDKMKARSAKATELQEAMQSRNILLETYEDLLYT